MIRIPGRIPVTIYPTFWIVAAFIGFANTMTGMGTLMWMGIIFVSVLVHEYGHALTSLLFGKKPRIELVALGGLTYHEGEGLPFWKQFFIVFNGPLFGFFLFILATIFLHFFQIENQAIKSALLTFQWINFYWTLLNLLPVMPLDGGQLLRLILEAFFGVKGFRYALLVSTSLAALLSFFFFLTQSFLIGALFFLLAYESFDAWRKSRVMAEEDRKSPLKKELEEGEMLLLQGKKEEALAYFEHLYRTTKKGMIHLVAAQNLAFLKKERGELEEIYTLLLPLKGDLSDDALCLLHQAAFVMKDYPLVVELSGLAYQTWPSLETALHNAYACATLSQEEPTIGWLQTAHKEGLKNLDEVLRDPVFAFIRHHPALKNLS